MIQPTTKKPFTVAAMRHSGTHLITPLVRYLTGRAVYSPKGDVSLECQPGEIVVLWLRDPRNWLVSAFKFKRIGRGQRMVPASPETYDAALADFMPPYIDFARRWADRWVHWPGALTCRFELFTNGRAGSVQQVERLQGFLGATAFGADPAEVYERVFAKSGTYTGAHSHWPQWFGERSASTFHRLGGPELSVQMGYHP